ncbi:hypothetical protein [Streptomyces profundus]|uniref:hypothetical protein n=1 Tax=Streptomyces profundus TaxID=2867410 RepID=UPI001D1613EA|nr:hypothetical protein [Streptomyces sp. MA3_2.13]
MPERTTAPRRRRRLVRGAGATLVLLGVGAYAAIQYEAGSRSEPHCVARGADGEGSHELTPAQAANAATIAAVGATRELPERAVTIAIATAMQESSLRNLDYGDRDSLGLFQQRPSMGWGTPEEVTDPVYASDAFYDELLDVPDYLTLPLTVAAQEVQRSAHPDEYAKHETNAALLSGALTGRVAAGLHCTTGNDRVAGDTAALERLLTRDFGAELTVSPVGDGDVWVPMPAGATAESGWRVAHWSMTRAAELGIERVVWDGRVWESARSDEGWRAIPEDSAEAGDSDANSTASPAIVRISLFAAT